MLPPTIFIQLRTKRIGVLDAIINIAERHNLLVIDDAAQGTKSNYKGMPLGSIGHLAALSFQETKYIISGEG